MRCIGRNKNLGRCSNSTPFLYCKIHSKQWILLLLITIPTVIGLYAGIFQDLLKPIFSNNSALTDEYKLNQMKSVLRLNNELNSNDVNIKFLFDNYEQYCEMKETNKCDSYYEITSRPVNLGKFQKYLNPENYEFDIKCQMGVITEKDSARTQNDSLIYFFKVKKIAEGTCSIDFEKNTSVYDKNLIKFLDKYLNDFYLPISIKEQIEIISELKYLSNKMSRIEEKNKQWFLITKYDNKEIKHTNSEELAYEIYWKDKNIKFYEFTSLLTNINFEIKNWMNENDLE